MNPARKQIEPAIVPVDDPWVSVPQAARELDVANATVRSLAARRELVSQVVAGRLVILRDSVADYIRRRDTAPAGAR